jgi:dTDP-4-amino-4,6-dideoxygalactose transaminase
MGTPQMQARYRQYADAHGLVLIEDCAQAHGALWQGKKVGTWGHVAALSFYPTKNLGCIGDGGAVLCSESQQGVALRKMRQYGWEERYNSAGWGINSRLDEVQAAVLLLRLQKLDAENGKRRQLAGVYHRLMQGLPVRVLQPDSNAVPVWHQYPIFSGKRDRIKKHLDQKAIPTALLYPIALQDQKGLQARMVLAPGGAGQAAKACAEVLCLPMHPWMEESDCETVVKHLLECL